jgi:hypothetical protein
MFLLYHLYPRYQKYLLLLQLRLCPMFLLYHLFLRYQLLPQLR